MTDAASYSSPSISLFLPPQPSVFPSAVNRCRVQHCNHNPPGHIGKPLTREIYLFLPSLLPSLASLSLPSSVRPQRTGCGSVVITELNDLACSAIDGFVSALVFCPIWGNFLGRDMPLRGPLRSIQSKYESITSSGQSIKQHQKQNLRVCCFTHCSWRLSHQNSCGLLFCFAVD